MNKFMAGLTLGIIATTCFFILYRPFEKKADAPETPVIENTIDSLQLADTIVHKDSVLPMNPGIPNPGLISNKIKVNRDSLVSFSKALLGTPYLYGSIDPAKGFDCSGFITYVFNHFKITVPRSSYEFANIGQKATLTNCKPGDVILFTGTDPLERAIGHIGIICEVTNNQPSFIHSTSGKSYGVTITSMENKFYQERFIAVIDLLSLH